MAAWKYLQHQNVLPLLGVKIGNNQFAMVSEWMKNGNINNYVKARWDVNRFKLVGFFYRLPRSFTDPFLQLGDAASGLIYMHDQGMIHGDLKGVSAEALK